MKMSTSRVMLRLVCMLAILALLIAPLTLSVDAAGPWMEVRYLRVLVNAILDGDLTIGDDLTVTDDLAVSGDATITGATSVGSTMDVTGDATVGGTLSVAGATTLASDVTVSEEATGGNAGAKNEISGLPRVTLAALGAMTNGTTETTLYIDDSPAGEWSAVTAGTSVVVSGDTAIYRGGTTSLKAAFTVDAVADEGVTSAITPDDLEANESIGFWVYSSVTLASGDLALELTDDAPAQRVFAIPAVTTANKWHWVELDISALTGGTGNVISAVSVVLTSQGETALGAFNLYLDDMYKWDAADEITLGTAIIQDGVLSVLGVLTAAAGDNTMVALVEGTAYFVHYQASNDAIVMITDQSTYSGMALVAY